MKTARRVFIMYSDPTDEREYGWINCAEHTDLIY